jgi:hypothetical protein
MEQEMTLDKLVELYNSGGWALALPAALQASVQVWSSAGLQSVLSRFAPSWLLWENWGDWTRRGFMTALALIGGVVGYFAAGMPLPQVGLMVVEAALGAHVLNAAKRYEAEKKSSATTPTINTQS